MEPELCEKINPMNDFMLPDKLDLTQFKGIKTSKVLEYLSIIYNQVPEVRADIIKALMETTFNEILIDKLPN